MSDYIEIGILLLLVGLTSKIIYMLISKPETTSGGPTPLRRNRRAPKVVKMTEEREAEIEQKKLIEKGWSG